MSHYDDAFDSVMSYAVLQLEEDGVKVKLETKEDIHNLLLYLNDKELKKNKISFEKQKNVKKGGKVEKEAKQGRISADLIHGLKDSDRALHVMNGGSVQANKKNVQYGVPQKTVFIKNGVLGRFGKLFKFEGGVQPVQDQSPFLKVRIEQEEAKGREVYEYVDKKGRTSAASKIPSKKAGGKPTFRDVVRGTFVSGKALIY